MILGLQLLLNFSPLFYCLDLNFLAFDLYFVLRMSLFPSRFHRSFHLPSFDINDLNGVDNLIIGNSDVVFRHVFLVS